MLTGADVEKGIEEVQISTDSPKEKAKRLLRLGRRLRRQARSLSDQSPSAKESGDINLSHTLDRLESRTLDLRDLVRQKAEQILRNRSKTSSSKARD